MSYNRLLPLIMICTACQPEFEAVNPYEFVAQDLIFFSDFVNAPADPEGEKKLVLSNDSYPIDVALFTDGNFYYDLPNLGDGTGTWTHKEGFLDLYAERKLFAMKMSIHSVRETNGDLVIHFTDRFGTQYLPLIVQERL